MPRDFIETVTQSARNLIAEDLASDARRDALVEYLRTWLSPDELADLMDATIAAAATGSPPPAFCKIHVDADSWAALASEHELAAYAWAAARRLPLARQAGLLRELMLGAAREEGLP